MLNIYDIAGNTLLSVPETEGCEHVAELMNSDYVKLSFVLATGNALPQGAYVVYKGETYRLFEPYTPARSNEVEYKYEPKFHSKVMGWTYKPFFFLQADGGVVVRRESDWSLTGTIADFLNRIVASIADETGEAYSFDYDLSLIGSKSIQFQAVDIVEGLNMIAEAWDTEWWVSSTVIHLSRCAHSAALALAVGTNVGVPTVTRNDEGYYTRFYAFGSTRNIPQDYTSGSSASHVVQRRLTLPVATCPNGYKDIREGMTPVEINSKVLIFDHIYPKSALTISSVRYETRYRYDADGNRIQIGTEPDGDPIYETYRVYFFQIAGYTFDLESIIEGKTLSVHFETGNLAGWEYELSYRPEEDEFEIIIDESTGYILPNELLSPAVDDQIVLFNISMPAEYTASAEEELEEALDEEIERLTSDVSTYQVNSYPVQFASSGITLSVGRNVNFTNGSLFLATRVLAITEKLDEPYTVSIRLGEKITKKTTKRLQEEIVDVNKSVEAVATRLLNVSRAWRNYRSSSEILDMIFDADGYFDGTKIRPESIETMMLRVGSRSQQLSFNSVIEPNYGGDPNSIRISAGSLANYGIADTVQNWNIGASTYTLASTGAYYIYARCSKSDAAGIVILSQEQITVDEDEDYYHFLLGILHSVDSGVRWISLTYGSTSINGRFIRTGRIISQDNLNYFDLDQNKFAIGDLNSRLDWNDTRANTLTLRGVFVQNSAGEEVILPSFKGAYQHHVEYKKGDIVSYQGSSWVYVYDTPSNGNAPGFTIRYGLLYNHYAVLDERNICSEGSHIPTWEDIIELAEYYGCTIVNDEIVTPNTAGSALKEVGLTHWSGGNADATNASGLNIRGSGRRLDDGDFAWFGTVFTMWGSTPYSGITIESSSATLYGGVHPNGGAPRYGRSLRPVKDTTPLSHGETGIYIGNDGKVYRTICIGTKEWVADNLAETRYRNGDLIQVVDGEVAWRTLTTGALCAHGNVWDNVAYSEGNPHWLLVAEVGRQGAEGPQGVRGNTGSIGPQGPMACFQGEYSASKTYYGSPTRVDIVKYEGLYYVSKTNAYQESFSNRLPTNEYYWRPFGANFESVATSLLFAELAYVNNLGVRIFEGQAKPYGNLSGSFSTIQANQTGVARVDHIDMAPEFTYGSADISCNGVSRNLISDGHLLIAIESWVVSNYTAFYNAGVIIDNLGYTITFTARYPGTSFTEAAAISNEGGIYGSAYTFTENQTAQARIDRCTLTGTGGCAYIIVSNVNGDLEFNGTLDQTAADFVSAYADIYDAAGIIVTYSSNMITFTAKVAGTDFVGTSIIRNNQWVGSIKIVNNEIWENAANDDTYGAIKINDRGYQGGYTRNRATLIGDGKGKTILCVTPIDAGGMFKGLNLVNGMPLRLAQMGTAQINELTGREGTLAYDMNTHSLKVFTNNGWRTVQTS